MQAPYLPILHNVAGTRVSRRADFDPCSGWPFFSASSPRLNRRRLRPPRPKSRPRASSAVRRMARGPGGRGPRARFLEGSGRGDAGRPRAAARASSAATGPGRAQSRASPATSTGTSPARSSGAAASCRREHAATAAPHRRRIRACSGGSSWRSGAWRAATAATPAATPVFRALATLAWEPRRAAFFRGELFDALTMVAARAHRGDVDDRVVGRRDGPDPVHAVELSEVRAWTSTGTAAATSGAAPATRSRRSPTISRATAGTTTRPGAAR